MKNIIIINDFTFINGGSDKVSFDYYNELKKIDNLNVLFFSYYKNLNNKHEEIKPHLSVNATKKINSLQHIFNINSLSVINKIKRKYHYSDTVFIVHTFSKGFSPSIFYFIKSYKTILIAHDYLTICPNTCYFNFSNMTKCTLKPYSLKCLKESCCLSNSYLEKIGRVLRGLIQKICFYFNNNLIIIPVSNFSKQLLSNHINISEKPVYSVFNDIFKKSKNVIPSKNNQIIYIGRIDYDKGVINLIKNVMPFFPDQTFVFIGDGDKRLVEMLRSCANVVYMGYQGKKVIYEQLKKSKLLLFPTLWHETFSLVVYEAAKFGIPSVISSDSAPTEIFEDKVSSFHYDFSSNTHVKKLREIIYDNELLDRVGKHANLILNKNKFNKNININNLINYLRK